MDTVRCRGGWGGGQGHAHDARRTRYAPGGPSETNKKTQFLLMDAYPINAVTPGKRATGHRTPHSI